VPHEQSPLWHRSARRESHAAQASPVVPHAVLDGVMHWPVTLQQPLGHDVASHTQAPPVVHRCPVGHAGPEPHMHEPSTHTFARFTGHMTQLPPSSPQFVRFGAGTHASPLQQPPHEALSHTHSPPTQRCPAAHGAPAPHAHSPCESQVSERASQLTHAAPGSPQAPAEIGRTHVEPEQHPSVHVVEQPAQTPFTHASAPHEVHAEPPEPQNALLVVMMHVSPSQHPSQLSASHTHVPLSQCCPGSHGSPVPHWQLPSSHRSASSGSHATHSAPLVSHAPRLGARHTLPSQHPFGHEVAVQRQPALPKHSCPGPHAAWVPHRHVPSVSHRSERVASQSTHVAPATPQVSMSRGTQTLFWQQPGQLLVQTQRPD
jgi:hypothetical protein